MKSRQSASSDTAAIDARELSLNGVVGALGAEAAAVATVAVDRADALTLRLDSSFVVHIRGMCRTGGRLVSCAREKARRTVLCASDGRSVGCVGMVIRRQPTGPSSCTAALKMSPLLRRSWGPSVSLTRGGARHIIAQYWRPCERPQSRPPSNTLHGRQYSFLSAR